MGGSGTGSCWRAPTAPGDFNNDGVVHASDYTVWRDNLGITPEALSGNGSGAETVVEEDYGLWRDHFGAIGLQNTVLMYVGGGEGALAGTPGGRQ